MTLSPARLLIAAGIGCALIAIPSCVIVTTIKAARAAERTMAGEYEIVLFRAGKDYRIDRPTFETIAGPFESREHCRNEITRVRVMESGVRLRCDPVEEGRVR